MDLGDVADRVKRANALDRQIKFIKAQRMLTEQQRARLVEPLELEMAAVLAGPQAQGSFSVQSPAVDSAAQAADAGGQPARGGGAPKRS